METAYDEQIQRLVSAIKPVYDAHRTQLEDLKRECLHDWDSPDFVWEGLLRSASTWGAARGIKLMNPENIAQIRYEALLPLTASERRARLETTVKSAGVRYLNKKPAYLDQNFEKIKQYGGPEKVKELLISKPDPREKMSFLRTFRGIGPKYSRNIMMDTYHEDFRDSIAIDSRLKKILKLLAFEFDGRKYEQAEQFFLKAAHKAGLNGWELDRLLFNYDQEVLRALQAQTAPDTSRATRISALPKM